mmetsp:Transcript_73966/g.128334  ORF Transcript_73966/g.128334 Transcript_73966/m.128334 type:complete len:368 (-) Transcript_73966:15-1118(-)
MSQVVYAVAISLLVVVAFGVLCFGQVDQNQYGLVFNWVTKQIGNKVYHGGTHFIGFWNTFVVFPATVQTIEFSERPLLHTSESLHTRTKEGLGLHLSIAFQYKLNPDKIPDLYALTNSMYEGLYTRIARDQLLEAASQYEGPQYWLERKNIGDHMRRLVDGKLRESYSSLWGLQLLEIDLPDQYEGSITKTQVEQQMIRTRKNEQIAAGIRADTTVMEAEYGRQIQVVQAGATANYSLVTRLAEAEAAKRRIKAEAGVLSYVRDKMKLSAKGAVEYQQLQAYAGLENATFLTNVMGITPVIPAAGEGSSPAKSFLQEQVRQQATEDQSAAESEASPSQRSDELSLASGTAARRSGRRSTLLARGASS